MKILFTCVVLYVFFSFPVLGTYTFLADDSPFGPLPFIKFLLLPVFVLKDDHLSMSNI